MATIIFDFDDTLFDTYRLKKETSIKFGTFGINHKDEKNAYKECKAKHGVYCLDNQIQILKSTYNFSNKKEIYTWFSELNLKSYVFPDIHKKLKKLSKDHHLVLLTKGEKKFQNEKITGANIKKYFKEIHITKNEKEEFLKTKKFKHPIYFINDKTLENKKVKKEFPKINILRNKKGEFNHKKIKLSDSK